MKKGDFDRIYARYYRLVLHVAYDMLKDYNLAQDVCQEVFVRFYEKIEDLDEERVKGWFLRVAERKSIDFFRKMYRKKEINAIMEQIGETMATEYLSEAENESNRNDFRNFVLEELRQKNLDWYNLMDRVVLGNEPAGVVAEEYGITEANLRMKLSRARKWLNKNYYKRYREL